MSGNGVERYSRQLLFWGEVQQERIAGSTLLVAGLGGLGATVAQLMVRGGVRALHIVDDGIVALSDLHRQTLYGECDIGRKKAEVARERLHAINSEVKIIASQEQIDKDFSIPEEVHGVADCLDNFIDRFHLYRAVPTGTFFVHGGVQGNQGQVLTLIKGGSQPLEVIFAGCRQPEGVIPVTPDSACVIAGIMGGELFSAMAGVPKFLDRFLVVDLANYAISFLDV